MNQNEYFEEQKGKIVIEIRTTHSEKCSKEFEGTWELSPVGIMIHTKDNHFFYPHYSIIEFKASSKRL